MKCDYCPNEAVAMDGEQNHRIVCDAHREVLQPSQNAILDELRRQMVERADMWRDRCDEAASIAGVWSTRAEAAEARVEELEAEREIPRDILTTLFRALTWCNGQITNGEREAAWEWLEERNDYEEMGQ